ncbi:hypothetical protein B0H14DRAFT_2651491 [Mycena olivaceomarginata]|nr:hypothetical protein B0H14DRAFT_2651491 [Mycena olivaceomarginata]
MGKFVSLMENCESSSFHQISEKARHFRGKQGTVVEPDLILGRQCKPVVPGSELSVLSRGIHTSAQHPVTSNVDIFEPPTECIPRATASPMSPRQQQHECPSCCAIQQDVLRPLETLMTIGLFSTLLHMNCSVLSLFFHPASIYSAGVYNEHRPVLPLVQAESPEPLISVDSSGIHAEHRPVLPLVQAESPEPLISVDSSGIHAENS